MQFQHPEILWGLLALVIPIIIHLFNFRRYKRVAFSNVAFLEQVKTETNKASKIRNLILLFIRLLLIAALVFAFAQPFLPTSESAGMKGQRSVSIYIDNSFSSQNVWQGNALLEWHKEKASQVVQSFSNFDRFQILTNDITGKDLQSLSKDEALSAIQSITYSTQPQNFSELNERQNAYFSKASADIHLHYWFSDFQKNQHSLQLASADTSHHYYGIPTYPDQNSNISIDTLYFKSNQRVLNQADTLVVALTNHGKTSHQANVQLDIDGSQKAVASIDLPAESQQLVTLNFATTSGGIHNGQVSVADEFIPFDNSLFFTYEILEKINVLEFAGTETKRLNSLFENDPNFSFESRTIESFQSELSNNIQLILCQGVQSFNTEQIGWLESFVQNGGSVFLLPHSASNLDSYNNLLGRLGSVQMLSKNAQPIQVQSFELKDPFYAPAFEKLQENTTLPRISSHFPLANNNLNSVSLITLQDNSPLLCYTKKGAGKIYVSSVSTVESESNFTQHALFPISVVRAAELSGKLTPTYANLSENSYVSLSLAMPSASGLYTLKNVSTGQEYMAQSRNNGNNVEIFIPNEISNSGTYQIKNDQTVVGGIALNYPRSESSLNYYNKEEILALTSNASFHIEDTTPEMLGHIATKIAGGITYWWHLILAALSFLALEILIIQLWRTKS
ncbi:MAG: BatA domain-containing protein [Bacteroidota bacterium]|jgi:hypothetical protein